MTKKTYLTKAILTLSLLSLTTLTACGDHSSKSSQSADSSKSVKISKPDKKDGESSPKKTSDKAINSEIGQNTEKTSDVSVSEGNNISSTSNTQTTQEGGMGATMVTSGTLDLWEDTPVYTEPNKSATVAFTQPSNTSIDWDNYFNENDDWWYSFVDSSGGKEVRYYIAYSDVKH